MMLCSVDYALQSSGGAFGFLVRRFSTHRFATQTKDFLIDAVTAVTYNRRRFRFTCVNPVVEGATRYGSLLAEPVATGMGPETRKDKKGRS